MMESSYSNKRLKTGDESPSILLQELLAQLGHDERILNLSILASMHIPKKYTWERMDTREESAREQAKVDQLALFETHIGPYDDVFNKNVTTHISNLHEDDLVENVDGRINDDRYTHPRFNGIIKGPHPDPCVWMGLLFGRDAEEHVRNEIEEEFNDYGEDSIYRTMQRWLVHKPQYELSLLDVMTNVLQYLRREADQRQDAAQMLRFCALYGLSGAIDDVLAGKYGPVSSGGVTVNTLLPFKDYGVTDNYGRFTFEDQYMPAWAFAAVLGYENVVHHLIHTRGSKTDVNLQLKMKNTGDFEEAESLPGLVLEWTIATNQPDMMTYLVSECGFQFRWLSDRMDHLFEFLLHINRSRDEYSIWRPSSRRTLPEDAYMMYDRDERNAIRSFATLKIKMKMLQAMIDAGLPMELFLPQINVDVENRMNEVLNDSELDEQAKALAVTNLFESLTPLEQKARFRMCDASAGFDVTRHYDQETLTDLLFCYQRMVMLRTGTFKDFNDKIVQMWSHQTAAQEARLPEFEKLDPRWTKYDENGDAAFEEWWGAKSRYDADGGDYQ